LPANLVTIDSDLYETYVDSLAFVRNFLEPGAILYLDNYNSYPDKPTLDSKKVWFEFREISRWHFGGGRPPDGHRGHLFVVGDN
jgi:hypothetical protein